MYLSLFGWNSKTLFESKSLNNVYFIYGKKDILVKENKSIARSFQSDSINSNHHQVFTKSYDEFADKICQIYESAIPLD